MTYIKDTLRMRVTPEDSLFGPLVPDEASKSAAERLIGYCQHTRRTDASACIQCLSKGLTVASELPRLLNYMRERGSSLILNWGEDNNLWECSWITGGKRYCGYSTYPIVALEQALTKCEDELGLPCPICKGEEGCYHTIVERKAAKAEAPESE